LDWIYGYIMGLKEGMMEEIKGDRLIYYNKFIEVY
jgi:hypothetical protein